MMLIYAPDARETSSSPAIAMNNEKGWAVSNVLHPGAWQWLILPLPPEQNRDTWIRFQVQPAWNPRKTGFPPDLGVFFGKVIVAPAPRH